jgi:MFS family permease
VPQPQDVGAQRPARSSRAPSYALAGFFAIVGFLPANWLVRVPDVKDQVTATAGELGLALLCGSIGGLAATFAAGRLCVHFGTRRVLVVAATLLSTVLVLPALAFSPPTLGAALVGFGVSQATFNIALNSTAVEVAAASGNPLMPGLHGIFSVGGLAGAATGGYAAAHLSPALHLALTAALGLLATLSCGAILLRPVRSSAGQPGGADAPTTPTTDATTDPGDSPAAHSGKSTPPDTPDAVPTGTGTASVGRNGWRTTRWVVLLFGVVAACTAFSEYANNNWAALHLREDLGASPAVAGYGYAAYAGAIAAGRFAGSFLIRRFGDTTVLAGGFAVAGVGMLVAAWAGQLPGGLPLAFGAYVVVGAGLANVYPLAISRGGMLGGPRGVSRVSMIAGLGVLSQAPVIGFVADRAGLPAALSIVVVLAAVGCSLALALRFAIAPTTRRQAATSPA